MFLLVGGCHSDVNINSTKRLIIKYSKYFINSFYISLVMLLKLINFISNHWNWHNRGIATPTPLNGASMLPNVGQLVKKLLMMKQKYFWCSFKLIFHFGRPTKCRLQRNGNRKKILIPETKSRNYGRQE